MKPTDPLGETFLFCFIFSINLGNLKIYKIRKKKKPIAKNQ